MDPKKVRRQRFERFEPEAFRFLAELESNNERGWFQENKDRYQRLWGDPLDAFLEDAEPVLGPGKRFRIHRDVRFSKDKRPYKTHASAVFEKDGIVHYLHLEKDHAFVATGIHDMAKDQCHRLYDAVVDDKAGKALERHVARLEDQGFEIGGEALKTAARGYPKDHPRVRFLRHKGLTASQTWTWNKRPPKWLTQPDLMTEVCHTWSKAKALNQWLTQHVGVSEQGSRWVR